MRALLRVDIGGTFTDLVVIDETTGTAPVGKVLTTPKDPAAGFEAGIDRPPALGSRPGTTRRTSCELQTTHVASSA